MPRSEPNTLTILKSPFPVLAAILLALTLACSGEPEVQIVEVEKVVEVEVVREIVVTATPAATPVPIPPTPVPPSPQPATPAPTTAPTSQSAAVIPTPVSNDYFVIMRYVQDYSYGAIEYFADFPSMNVYTFEGGGGSMTFKNPETFMNHLLEVGAITAEQRGHFSRGGAVKVYLDDLSEAVYILMHSWAYPGRGKGDNFTKDDAIDLSHRRMDEEFNLNRIALEKLLYYFDESQLNTGKHHSGSASSSGSTPRSEASPTSSFDAASLLARFSTSDPAEGEGRAAAVSEIIARYQSGNANRARITDFLHTISPELSIAEYRQSADELARISEDGRWDETETAEGVFYLATFITGDEPNYGERVEAAHEMVALYETGDLDANHSLNLMDTIAPSLGINQRRQAAAALAKLSAEDDWDDDDRMAAASEVFRLVTGVPLNAEQRMAASVDLAGVGVEIFDTDDSFDDRDIDNAAEVIKRTFTGDLTSDSLPRILNIGN